MFILKIVLFLKNFFGWKRECEVLYLPSPKKFDLTNIRSQKLAISYLYENENQEVAVTFNDSEAIDPGKCKICFSEVGLLAFGVIILVGLCMASLFKMLRKKMANPIQQVDEEDTFYDLEENEEDEENLWEWKFNKEDQFLDPKSAWEDIESWHTSTDEIVLHCRILTDEECAEAPPDYD